MKISLKKRLYQVVIITLFIFLIFPFYRARGEEANSKEEAVNSIQNIFENRNKAILNGDLKLIEGNYDKNTRYGTWAYEHEEKKMKYLKNWEEKQNVKFTQISPDIVIKRIRGKDNKYSVNLICSTEYSYIYKNDPKPINKFRIGTSHILNIAKRSEGWIITKEWYKDPFADSLNLNNLKIDNMNQYIQSQNKRDFSNIGDRRKGAVEYADKYCGIASEKEYGYSYNRKYRNYNSQGGDCANFASQILHEGGKFRKNSSWNYDKTGATASWINAGGFKDYMMYSGRASLVAHGSYEKVYKASYKLLPGDFVAYEKKGDITHISVVTGADSKGYSLVSCHNTDRSRVPWDLGWSDKNIKFWLVHVNY
ncbi:amidase domain-containing protein [Clostridium coskatii]|uniref:Amidase domain protein n=1 Tax=Clostridium coskatii TaxID=1705578 RepID=A0A166TPN8_9CLOT|nr:amidase domain-containing protein [Clostridium coskatii]OAA93944.1 putative amidase domain protein [Clostridium coskatii]OBR95273.1 putative amidase domain protein [Clostridium coskatii]